MRSALFLKRNATQQNANAFGSFLRFSTSKKDASILGRQTRSKLPPLVQSGQMTWCLSSSSSMQPQSSCLLRTSRRSMSNIPPNLRAYPQYTVFGEQCLLTVKLMPPGFRVVGGNTLALDTSKRGRIILEWTPRESDGKANRDHQVRFALSPEEVGLLVDQLPSNPIVLSRKLHYAEDPGAEKVLHITPGKGGTVQFRTDFEMDGIGGFSAPGDENGVKGPLDVVVQTGEWQVIKSIFASSLPHLVGWTTMMETSIARAMEAGLTSNTTVHYQNKNDY